LGKPTFLQHLVDQVGEECCALMLFVALGMTAGIVACVLFGR
jgi:hypothetical protein